MINNYSISLNSDIKRFANYNGFSFEKIRRLFTSGAISINVDPTHSKCIFTIKNDLNIPFTSFARIKEANKYKFQIYNLKNTSILGEHRSQVENSYLFSLISSQNTDMIKFNLCGYNSNLLKHNTSFRCTIPSYILKYYYPDVTYDGNPQLFLKSNCNLYIVTDSFQYPIDHFEFSIL